MGKEGKGRSWGGGWRHGRWGIEAPDRKSSVCPSVCDVCEIFSGVEVENRHFRPLYYDDNCSLLQTAFQQLSYTL